PARIAAIPPMRIIFFMFQSSPSDFVHALPLPRVIPAPVHLRLQPRQQTDRRTSMAKDRRYARTSRSNFSPTRIALYRQTIIQTESLYRTPLPAVILLLESGLKKFSWYTSAHVFR